MHHIFPPQYRAMIFIVLFSLSLNACFTLGKEFPTDTIATLTPYKLTKYDVAKQFGEPYRVGLNNGKLTWTYLHYELSPFSNPVTTDLTFTFNAEGKMTQYQYNTNDANKKVQLDSQ